MSKILEKDEVFFFPRDSTRRICLPPFSVAVKGTRHGRANPCCSSRLSRGCITCSDCRLFEREQTYTLPDVDVTSYGLTGHTDTVEVAGQCLNM